MTDADLPDFPTLEARVRYAMTFEPHEREQARRRSGLKAAYTGPARRGTVNGVVAHRVGLSEVVYYRARVIVRAVDDDTLPEHVREVARRELATMNLTGAASGPYQRLRLVLPAPPKGRPQVRPLPRPRDEGETQRTRRRPVLERAEAAIYQITRYATSLENAMTDNRWPGQRAKLAPASREDLRRVVAKLRHLNDQIPPTEGNPTP